VWYISEGSCAVEAGALAPVSDARRHAEVDELQLDDLLVVSGDDAVQHAADARRVDLGEVGRRARPTVTFPAMDSDVSKTASS